MAGSNFRQRKRSRSNNSKLSTKSSLVAVSKKQVDQNQSRTIQRLVKLTRGIAPERKFFDTSIAFINIVDTVGAIQNIVLIPQGDGVSDRTGNKIRVKSVYVQVRVSTQSVSGLAEAFLRFALVQDTQQVADSTPTVSQIVNSTATPQNTLLSIPNQGRFRILKMFPLLDLTMVASANATQSAVQAYRRFGMDIPITYNGAAGSDIQKNGLYLIAWTTEPTDVVDADGITRVTYVDD